MTIRKVARLSLVSILIMLLTSACSSASQAPSDDYAGTEINDAAPDFQLTDQNEETIKLSDFQGKIVVLTFMDTECVDTCPVTALRLRQVNTRLEDRADVVFLGVNVNNEASEVGDMLEATEKWQLTAIPSWHFLTGSEAESKPVWEDYFVGIDHSPDGALRHTSGVFIIDTTGQRRWYLSIPMDDPNWQGSTLDDILYERITELFNETS